MAFKDIMHHTAWQVTVHVLAAIFLIIYLCNIFGLKPTTMFGKASPITWEFANNYVTKVPPLKARHKEHYTNPELHSQVAFREVDHHYGMDKDKMYDHQRSQVHSAMNVDRPRQ